MTGRIDTETLKRMVADDEIDTVIAAFPDMYGRLVGKPSDFPRDHSKAFTEFPRFFSLNGSV